jgi:hypothetical protein
VDLAAVQMSRRSSFMSAIRLPRRDDRGQDSAKFDRAKFRKDAEFDRVVSTETPTSAVRHPAGVARRRSDDRLDGGASAPPWMVERVIDALRGPVDAQFEQHEPIGHRIAGRPDDVRTHSRIFHHHAPPREEHLCHRRKRCVDRSVQGETPVAPQNVAGRRPSPGGGSGSSTEWVPGPAGGHGRDILAAGDLAGLAVRARQSAAT